jgi:hypothetical protein
MRTPPKSHWLRRTQSAVYWQIQSEQPGYLQEAFQLVLGTDEAPWRARPKFCLDLRITYSDGSVETISTGQDWQTAHSPVIFNMWK